MHSLAALPPVEAGALPPVDAGALDAGLGAMSGLRFTCLEMEVIGAEERSKVEMLFEPFCAPGGLCTQCRSGANGPKA